MKRSPIRRKPKKNPIPKEVLMKVCLRSGGEWIDGECIGGQCESCANEHWDWRGLQFSHDIHRGMGGTSNPEINTPENIKRRCAYCHDLKDKRVYE